VRVEQFVVIFGAAIARVAETNFVVAVGNFSDRNGGMGDVVKEGMARTDCQMSHIRRVVRVGSIRPDRYQVERGAGSAGSRPRLRVRCIRSHDDLREAGRRIGNEVPVRIGRKERQVSDVIVGQIDTEDCSRLRLHLSPRRQPAVGAVEQPARCMWLAVRPDRVLAQEHLVRGVRGVSLILIDE
jgi:hypothetical protein